MNNQTVISQDPVDLGIVIALQEEFRELLTLSGPYTQHKEEGITAYRFNRGSYRIVAAFVGDMGQSQATRVTERMISTWHPESIVVMGIAAGVHDDLRVGDVYIPPQAVEYLQDPRAVAATRTEIQELGFVPYFAPRGLERLQVENLEDEDSH